MTHRNNKKRAAWLASRYMLACTALTLVLAEALPVIAESDNAASEEASEKIVKLFCGDDGKLARCAGQAANDCPQIVKPHVDDCLDKVEKREATALSDAFERCFWKGFTAKYGKGFDYSPECFSSDNKDGNPLQPIPQQLEEQMKLLNSKP